MSKQALKDSIASIIRDNIYEDIGGNDLQEKLFEVVDACYPTKQTILLSSTNFTDDAYQNDALIGLTADIDFELFTNGGSGVMLKNAVGYDFDAETGTISTTPQDYKLKIL